MRHALPALLLLSTGCFTTVPSVDLPLEAFGLQATVSETRSGRVRVEVQLDHCWVSLQRILLEGDDRLEATLGGRTIALTPGWFAYPGGTYSGIFPRTTDPTESNGELRVVLLRQEGSLARPGATVQVPAEVRIVSPRKREPVSRGSEDLEVTWTPLRAEGDAPPGAELARWEVTGAEACSSADLVPELTGEVVMRPETDGFVLPAGTLALPPLSGEESCKSELLLRRINTGTIDEGFCVGSSIQAERESARVFRSTP